jgi:hypothetical protein
MQMRFIRHVEAFGPESIMQLVGDTVTDGFDGLLITHGRALRP